MQKFRNFDISLDWCKDIESCLRCVVVANSELDNTGVLENVEDDGEPKEEIDETVEVTEEMMDEADVKRSQATKAFREGKSSCPEEEIYLISKQERL